MAELARTYISPEKRIQLCFGVHMHSVKFSLRGAVFLAVKIYEKNTVDEMCHYTYKRAMTDLDGPDMCYSLASKRGARYLARLYDRCFVPVNITSSQFSILSLIDHEPRITVVKLANLMVMERTSLVRALATLEKAGFVEKSVPKSGRALEFSLTKAGSKKVRDAIPLWKNAQLEFEKQFGKEKAASLREILLSVA